MPRTNIGKQHRDTLKELLQGRRAALGLDYIDIAPKVGMHRVTLSNKLNSSSDCLTIGELKQLCRVLDIPIEEARAAIKM